MNKTVLGIPEPAHEMGYTTEQIEKYLTEEDAAQFWRWMVGQTMAYIEGVGTIVYEDDFRRWVTGARRIWD